MELQALKFQNPQLLHLLWGVVVLIVFFYLVFKWKDQLLNRFGQIEMVKKLMPGYSRSRAVWKSILFIIAYIFLVIAVANPQLGTKIEEVKREGIDIIIALDVSMSMKAEDITPNRLEKAKHEIAGLIDLLQGDRIGLVAFAGMAHIQCPLTLDYSAAKLFLSMMNTDIIPRPGTAIGAAIEKAMKAFNQKERKHKVLILITDGEDHETDPVAAAEEAAKEGVRIYSIGLGSEHGVPIPIYDKYGTQTGFKKDRQGNVVTTKLDVGTLQKIAYMTGGKYYISSAGETELSEIFSEIDQMEKKELTSRQFSQYEDQFQIFIILALAALVVETFLPVRRKRITV